MALYCMDLNYDSGAAPIAPGIPVALSYGWEVQGDNGVWSGLGQKPPPTQVGDALSFAGIDLRGRSNAGQVSVIVDSTSARTPFPARIAPRWPAARPNWSTRACPCVSVWNTCTGPTRWVRASF